MDLHTIAEIRPARDRGDLAGLDASCAPLAGGSWLFGEPQHHLETLVDLTTLGWPAITITPAAPSIDPARGAGSDLSIAATCTLTDVASLSRTQSWPAAPLFRQACTALYGSFKIWNVATIGGNIATSLPAGPMTSLGAALDAHALVWRADGTDELVPVARLVTGNRSNGLATGDVLRSIEFSAEALGRRTAYRKIALSPLGRSGAVLIGTVARSGEFLLTITAATVRPVQLRFPATPTGAELAAAVDTVDAWFTDPHGAADWRHAVSRVLAEQIRRELGEVSG